VDTSSTLPPSRRTAVVVATDIHDRPPQLPDGYAFFVDDMTIVHDRGSRAAACFACTAHKHHFERRALGTPLEGHRLHEKYPPRVLLIENEPVIAAQLLTLLIQRRCHVTTFALGAEGLTSAATSQPDLLVLNIALLDMTGAEVVQQIRALNGLALLPVVFVSSERYDAAQPDASAGVVLKPFLMRDLGEALDFGLRPMVDPPATSVLPAA
jgi:CheY-like chemotaxis protein